ncbi:hypothetical protein LTR85_004887 [Meristemomyces frigidus]|nr:hypothetical protein LTR85_004887 [Meristemomyces frigidus]
MPSTIAPDCIYYGKASHEVLGERYLRQLGFSKTICELVGAHVMGKRYLTAVDMTYYEGRGKHSKTTMEIQDRRPLGDSASSRLLHQCAREAL